MPGAIGTALARETRHGQNELGLAVGRKNWLFVGSEDGAMANATFVSLIASCELHGLEPWRYLRDLFYLLPDWPKSRVLELAPAYFEQTLQQEEAKGARKLESTDHCGWPRGLMT